MPKVDQRFVFDQFAWCTSDVLIIQTADSNLWDERPENRAKMAFGPVFPREARAEGPSVARLINLSGRAGPSGAKPREFERKIYLYIYIYVDICLYL